MKGDLYTENEILKKKIKIGNSFYKIFVCDKVIFNGKDYLGFVNYTKRLIFLKKGKSLNETLNHEIIHALLNEVYLNSKKNKRIIKKLRSDEDFIESLRELIPQIKRGKCRENIL